WFPDVHATTATVNLGVGIPLSDTFSLALLADLRQTGMDMNSSTSSIIRDGYNGEAQLQNSIAGGAIDRYTLLMAGLTWRYGAGGESSSSDAEDEVYEDDDEAYEDDSESGAGDTSNPDFFSGDGSGAPATGGQDTSNPDFFE